MDVLPQEQPSTSHLFSHRTPALEDFLLPALGCQPCVWMSRSLHTLKAGGRWRAQHMSAVCWAFNTHSDCDEGGESLQAQSKAWGQLPLCRNHGQMASDPTCCTEKKTKLKMSPHRASVNSCDDAGGQSRSLMISACFVKEICHGKCTRTHVGAKVVENILSLPVTH